MIDRIGEILLSQDLCLVCQLLDQIGEQRDLIVQAKFKRCKACLNHTCTWMARLYVQYFFGKFLGLINAPAVECNLSIDRSRINIPLHQAVDLLCTGTHALQIAVSREFRGQSEPVNLLLCRMFSLWRLLPHR